MSEEKPKRGRGRPPGSRNKKHAAAHLLSVAKGVSKLVILLTGDELKRFMVEAEKSDMTVLEWAKARLLLVAQNAEDYRRVTEGE